MTPLQRPPDRLMCDQPSMCPTCFWAYPPRCLHTLEECERNSPQMNEIMDAFERFTLCCDDNPGGAAIEQFWDLPENARWVDKNLIRFIYFMVMKFLVQKEQVTGNWELNARKYLLNGALGLSGMIMCGSWRAARNALHPEGRYDELMDETHKLFGVAYNEILEMTLNCTYGNKGVILVMDLVSPCACLKEDVRQCLRDIRFSCIFCRKEEDGNTKFKACGGCQIARYCSRSCQKMHWNSSLQDGRHKKICPVIRKLLKVDFD
jgi:hypothetical protein